MTGNIGNILQMCDCFVFFLKFLGESRIFNQNETYQRALLHWNRAASQGLLTLSDCPSPYFTAC